MNLLIILGLAALVVAIATFIFPGLVLSKKQREVIEMRKQNPKTFALIGRVIVFSFSVVCFALGACLHFLPEYGMLWCLLYSVSVIGVFAAAFALNKVYLGRFVGVW